MFSDELEKINWEETTKAIYSKTEADVLRALGKSHCDVDDFMALISPAAEKFLEPMARLSRKYTEERFGKTISMFIPLYITNSCTNSWQRGLAVLKEQQHGALFDLARLFLCAHG